MMVNAFILISIFTGFSFLDEGPDEDLSNFTVQDDAFDELQAVVNRTMRLKTKKENNTTEKVGISLLLHKKFHIKIYVGCARIC